MPPSGGVPAQMLQTLVQAAGDVDQLLSGMADTFADAGGQEVSQARELVKVGVGKFLAKFGVTPGQAGGPAGGPPPGAGFPGGGFTSA